MTRRGKLGIRSRSAVRSLPPGATQGGGPRAVALEAPPEDGMRGPKAMAVAILVFFGLSMLGVHLLSLPGAPAGRAVPGAAAAPAPAPVARAEGWAPALARPPSPPAPAGGHDLPGATDLGVAPVPPPGAADRERMVNACIERKVASGPAAGKPVLPGRWPALKRAREEKRMQRLEARAICERELPG